MALFASFHLSSLWLFHNITPLELFSFEFFDIWPAPILTIVDICYLISNIFKYPPIFTSNRSVCEWENINYLIYHSIFNISEKLFFELFDICSPILSPHLQLQCLRVRECCSLPSCSHILPLTSSHYWQWKSETVKESWTFFLGFHERSRLSDRSEYSL